MKFYTDSLTFETSKHREYRKITPQVRSMLEKSGIQEGMILVLAMHITAGVWVNDAEDGPIADIDRSIFGPWQEVHYAEFEGEHPKRVIMKAMGE